MALAVRGNALESSLDDSEATETLVEGLEGVLLGRLVRSQDAERSVPSRSGDSLNSCLMVLKNLFAREDRSTAGNVSDQYVIVNARIGG